MEERKNKEIEYYNRQAGEYLKKISGEKTGADFEGFTPLFLNSYQFCYEWLAKNVRGKKVLDYGCGNGIHSIFLAKTGAEKVTGIDLSEKSLEIAKSRAKAARVEDKIEFLLMDCEGLKFQGNSFDIIFDEGTFSSLDLKKALPELARVLRPQGFLLGIETLGHNPFTNFKRKINKIMGKRTGWAESHIFQMKDLKLAKNYFNKGESHFFHLISWVSFPLINFPGGKFILKILESLDKIFLNTPILKKYAFKIVFIFSEPKK
ncbi:MAG: class I SAM-dependent methyltransferase [Candidatus Pacebacteria bacterium]|nr:class I SAM-dependent methyltransferase [Candidatus Paceibacterota bacterium]